MGYPKMKEVINQLHRRTMDDDLPWEETEDEAVYQTAFPNYSIRVSERPPKESQAEGMDYWVSIYNAYGKLVDEVSDPDMREDYENDDINPFDLMRELYDNARRTAMGVQVALSEILERLEGRAAQKEGPDVSEEPPN